MLRIYTDYQTIDSSGAFFVLVINGDDVENQVQTLGIKVGDKVILDAYQDFEIQGTLDFKYVDMLERQAWVAYPDWSTQKDKPDPST